VLRLLLKSAHTSAQNPTPSRSVSTRGLRKTQKGQRRSGSGGSKRSRLQDVGLGILTACLSGCSLFYESTQPVPGAWKNVVCHIEYWPDPDQPDGPDIQFLAAANPYTLASVYMNPFDSLVHGLFAPGRHLSEPLEISGATCKPPLWKKAHRLRPSLDPWHGLVCTRTGLEGVLIEARTKYGSCKATIPAGDSTPICAGWFSSTSDVLGRPPPESCTANGAG